MRMKGIDGIHGLLFTVPVFWGTSYVAAKLGMLDLMPLNLAILRFSLAALLFGSILLAKRCWRIAWRDLPQFFLLGFVAISFFYYLHYQALQYTTSTNAGLLMATSPVFVLLLCMLKNREEVTSRSVLGICLAFSGVMLVITRGDFSGIYQARTLPGDLLVAVNALMWAWVTLRGKYVLEKYSPFTAMAYIHICGALLLLPFAFIRTPAAPILLGEQLPGIHWMTVGVVVYLAVCCSVYSYFMWYYGVSRLGAVRTAVYNYFTPLIASLTGYLLFQEVLSGYVLGGGVLVILGVWLTNHCRSGESLGAAEKIS